MSHVHLLLHGDWRDAENLVSRDDADAHPAKSRQVCHAENGQPNNQGAVLEEVATFCLGVDRVSQPFRCQGGPAKSAHLVLATDEHPITAHLCCIEYVKHCECDVAVRVVKSELVCLDCADAVHAHLLDEDDRRGERCEAEDVRVDSPAPTTRGQKRLREAREAHVSTPRVILRAAHSARCKCARPQAVPVEGTA